MQQQRQHSSTVVLHPHFQKSIPPTSVIQILTTFDKTAEAHCGTNIITSSHAHETGGNVFPEDSDLRKLKPPNTAEAAPKDKPEQKLLESSSSLNRWQHSGPFITIKRLIYVKCERNVNRTSASGFICGCQGAVAMPPLSSETYFGEMIQQMVPVFCFVKNSIASSLITATASGALGRTRKTYRMSRSDWLDAPRKRSFHWSTWFLDK